MSAPPEPQQSPKSSESVIESLFEVTSGAAIAIACLFVSRNSIRVVVLYRR